MRRFILPLLVGILVLGSPLLGYEISGDRETGEKSPVLQVTQADERGMTLRFDLPELSMENVILGGQEFQAVAIPGGAQEGETGDPSMPIFSRMIAVPEGASVRVRSERLEQEAFTGVRVAPMQDEQEGGETPFAFNEAAYEAMREDDGVDVSVSEPMYLRDLRVVNLEFRPVHYDPASGSLTVAKRIEVDVEFEGGAGKAESAPLRVPSSFDRMYRELVVNYPDMSRSVTVVPGAILVISQNNAAVLDSLQPYIDWRHRKGNPVFQATTSETGSTNAGIKNYIQGIYNDPAVDLEYVVLVGDAGQIPTWYETLSGYNGEGDLPYAQLAGGDALPDVHLGRLSYGSMDELSIIVRKVVGYESAPYVASDPNWFSRGLAIGDPNTSSGISTVECARWLKNHMLTEGYTQVDSLFSSVSASTMLAQLQHGQTAVGYRGYWGTSGWSNAYVSAMNNGWKLPYCVFITCGTGSFASGTSNSEGFLRGGSMTPTFVPEGGIGSVGMATLGTHTKYNNCLFYGIFHGMLQEDLYTMGAAMTRGKVEMSLNYQSSAPTYVTIWAHWCNLMGDPALDVYTGFPQPMIVTHDATVQLGANSMPITVTSGGSPVEGALVCLWKGNETYATGYTAADGTIDLPMTNTTTGNLLLTVTKHNCFPYEATVPVGSGTHVGYLASTIDDDASGGSVGNGDGVVNPNETIELPVELENFGASPVSGVSASLSEGDPFVTIGDASETYGFIAAGGTAWSQEDFDFTVAPGCPDGHVIQFSLDATNGGTDWHSLVEIPVVSAALVYQGRTLYNDGGNGLDPGETVELSLSLLNDGGASATSVTGTLVSQSSYVSVVDGSGTFGTIAVDGTGDNSGDHFTISAVSNVYEGYEAAFLVVAQFSGGRLDTIPFTVPIGQPTGDDPTGPDNYGYLAYENVDTQYPEAPTYSWVELDPSYGGNGTEIVMNDTGDDNGVNKKVDLPFEFQYYGKGFDRVTVCSNGWVAMGESPSFSYRNWTIPGAGGPDAMIAPFWDDLTQVTGSKLFQRYDSENNRWILEWSRFRNVVGSAMETFEVILYDPAFHPTDTGDGIIEFQYETVNNVDSGELYATVGIESPDQMDGVLITFSNRYSGGASALAAGRAIRFLPVRDVPVGFLAGTVSNISYNKAPLEGAIITVLGAGRSFSSGGDGSYSGTVPPGSYSVTASLAGFEPDTVSGVSIVEEQTTVRDFDLVDNAGPILTVTPFGDTEDETGPYPVPVTILEYSGLPERVLYYRTNWDGNFHAVALDSLGSNEWVANIPGQPVTSIVEYYVSARDGLGQTTVDPPGAPANVYRFIVSQVATVVDDDCETNQGWTLGVAGDDATTGIWIHADPIGTDYNGNTVQPEDDHTPAPGTICFVTGNGAVGGAAGDADVDGGQTTLLSPVFDLSGYSLATLSYAVWYTNSYGSSPNADVWLVQATDDGSNWVDLENTTSSTNAWVTRSFSIDTHVNLTNQVRFRFIASDDVNGSLVEAAIDDILITGFADVATAVENGSPTAPLAYGLQPCRPNPFNPRTTIAFDMREAGRALVRVYDVSGRVVATLHDGPANAGRTEIAWSGKNDAGRDVTSGIYFVRFEAPGFLQVRQITLVR